MKYKWEKQTILEESKHFDFINWQGLNKTETCFKNKVVSEIWAEIALRSGQELFLVWANISSYIHLLNRSRQTTQNDSND